MPIVTVTCIPLVDAATRSALVQALPIAVATALDCAEEPFDGVLRPGDVSLRFATPGPDDDLGFDVLVEVRARWLAERAADRTRRCDRILAAVLDAVGPRRSAGVFLELPVSAWAERSPDRT